jgi:hypothetical protein
MGKPRPITPYERLLKTASSYATKVICRTRVDWGRYFPQDRLASYGLVGLHQAVTTAERLGYDTVLLAKDDGLYAVHIKKLPERPCEF